MGDEEKINSERRVRIHFAQTAKGAVQLDVTAEAETAEVASALLEGGLNALQQKIADRGLTIAGKDAA
jgi:hypothetical protein